eukprot:TRINITY_DN10683_c0_g1_i1.p1 TRINITY_DN10683_c0_g1~~TRINITY_DN10683_c0_g1_i1.p1  ORF type:complete len:722 (+),score=205.80 TRINITY_DN10683_c0_g1_i1:73-2166(+)
MLRSLVGSEMCIRDRVSTQSTGQSCSTMQNATEGIAYLGGALGSVAGNLATSVASYAQAKPESQICTMGCAEILKVSNALQGIFSTAGEGSLKMPELPQIVVIGSQSSGKSSLLNGIMAADILPLGEQMVTRTPLHLHLVNVESGMRAEFGSSSSGVWTAHWKIDLTDPNPTKQEIEAIRVQIEVETEQRAGKQKGISSEPIFLKIFSPYVPDLSLVDLPGLTMTALTDQGQPKDIREQIQAMLAKYAGSERSIILAVVPARQDLEADMALHFVREHDVQGSRTIGVMTKVDLMNADTDVSSYVHGNIPQALQLKYGYFLVKNRSTSEVKKGITVHQGFEQERGFFAGHKVYSKMGDARMGVPRLGEALSEILVEQLKAHLPSIIHEIDDLTSSTQKSLHAMGNGVPSDAVARANLVHVTISEFTRTFVGALDDRTFQSQMKIGRFIKDSFLECRSCIRQIDPFTTEEFPDAYIQEGIRDCEGNHLSFPIPPVEVLEVLLKDPVKRPIQKLAAPARDCVHEVYNLLCQLVDELLQKEHVARFPGLVKLIKDEVVGSVLKKHMDAALVEVDRLIAMEENYIFTDDPAFLKQLHSLCAVDPSKASPGAFFPDQMRSLLHAYYQTVQDSAQNVIPKAIMLCLVKAAQQDLCSVLFETVAGRGRSVAELVDEPADVQARRDELSSHLQSMQSARLALSSLL